MWYELRVSILVFIMTELKHRSVRGSLRSLLMISLNLDKRTFLGPNFLQMTILPLTLYYKDIVKDNVNVQEYMAYIKSMQKSTESQYLFQLMVKMNFVKIPGQQTLDFKRLPASPQILTGNKHFNSKKIRYDIPRMRSKACPTTCLCNWIIHRHILTSHYNRLSIFKMHHKEFSISFKCYSFKIVCSNLPTIVGLRIINVYVCRVHSLQSVCEHQFHRNRS